MPIKLSIIIVNWNTRDLLDACLRSLELRLRGFSHSITVVDNASSDGSVESIRRQHPAVQCIANTGNDGFSKGCNIGLRAAPASDYVLFLNPDTAVLDDSIQNVARYLDDHPDAGAATCALLDEQNHFQEAQGRRLPSIRTAFNQYLFLNRFLSETLFPGIYWTRPPKKIQEVEWISGAALMVRRSAMPEGPFFDEAYFMYAEDMEASLALRQKGWKLVFLPNAKLMHYVKKATRQSTPAVVRSPVSSQVLYLKRHTTAWQYAWITRLMGVGFYFRYCAYSILSHIRSTPAYEDKARNHRQYLTRLGQMRSS